MSSDRQLAWIQGSVLAAGAPLVKLWSQLEDQGLSGKPKDLIPVSEVLKILKTTLMLIGNASNYISETRRRVAIDTIKQSRPKLATFLREICNEDLGEASGDLFGPRARQKVIERANTIEAFNKALARVESGPSNTRNMVSSPLIAVFYPSARLAGTGTGQAKLSPRTNPDRPSTSSDPQSHTEVNGASTKGPESQHTPNTMPRHHNNNKTTEQTSWRSTSFSLPGMAEINRQPMDNTVHTRLPPRADRDPTRELPCALSSEATRAEQSPREKGSGSPSKGCNRANNKIRFLQPNVCSPKERWGVAPHYQPQEVECIPLSLSLQDGEYQQCEGCYPGERLHGKDRSERCLPDGSSFGEAPQISQVCVGRPVLPVQSLPFGLATAPRTFTKFLRLVAAEMRRKGVRLVMYLDDILVMAQTMEGLKEHLSQIASVLQSLGFTLNQQKCVWEPTRRIEFLGFIVDSETQMISLPRDNISKIRKECKSMSGKDRVTGRQLAQIIDLLSSAIPAILPASLHYQALQRPRCQALQQSQGDYESTIHLSTEAQRDLHWWIHDAPHCSGRPISCTDSRPSDNLGCLQNRLGSDMPRDPHRKSVGSTEEVQRKPTPQPGESGIAGVVRGRPIPFQDL